MNPRVLISDCDWRLLAFAFGDLRQHGFDVMVANSPDEALALARRWQPNVIIASGPTMELWEKLMQGKLEEALPGVSIVVTIGEDEPETAWQPLLRRGFELLPKPLIHASELRVAAESAIMSRRVSRAGGEYQRDYGPLGPSNIVAQKGTA